MLGVPEVNERVRPVQQRVDQGEDLHSAEKTSRQILKECLSMCLSVDNKATKYIDECPSFNPCTIYIHEMAVCHLYFSFKSI